MRSVPPSLLWLTDMIEKYELLYKEGNQHERKAYKTMLTDFRKQKKKLIKG